MIFSPTENEQSFKRKMSSLTDCQITALFREPRTMRKFEDRPVSDDQLRQIQELTYLCPTAFNSQPLRITWIKSIEARERLVKHLIESNREKALQAPINAILSYDKLWMERADVFNPRATESLKGYYTTENRVLSAAQQNANLQAGYFMIATRALGLDVGPLGADFDGLYEEFFSGTDEHPILVVNIGYGIPTKYPRDTRFGYDEVTRSL